MEAVKIIALAVLLTLSGQSIAMMGKDVIKLFKGEPKGIWQFEEREIVIEKESNLKFTEAKEYISKLNKEYPDEKYYATLSGYKCVKQNNYICTLSINIVKKP